MGKRFFYTNLDVLRFFAFLLVFVSHLPIVSHSGLINFIFNQAGVIGVQLFFIISGFLITGLLLNERQETKEISLKKFYLRRVFRIFPLYFFSLLVILAIVLILDQPVVNFSNFFGYYFTFLGNFDRIFNGFETVHYFLGAGVLWSIAVEEQFYLFIPILLSKLRKQRTILWVLSSIYVLTLCYKFYVIRTFSDSELAFRTLSFSPLSVFDAITFGCLLGVISIHFKSPLERIVKRIPWFGIIFAVLAVFGLIIVDFYQENSYISAIIVRQAITVLFTLIIALVCFHPRLKVVSMNKGVQWLNQLGKISFGLYIYHDLTIMFFDHYTDHLALIITASMASTIVISWASFNFLEQPFLRYKKRFEVVRTRE